MEKWFCYILYTVWIISKSGRFVNGFSRFSSLWTMNLHLSGQSLILCKPQNRLQNDNIIQVNFCGLRDALWLSALRYNLAWNRRHVKGALVWGCLFHLFANPHSEDFLLSFHVNSDCNIYSLFDYLSFTSDMKMYDHKRYRISYQGYLRFGMFRYNNKQNNR